MIPSHYFLFQSEEEIYTDFTDYNYVYTLKISKTIEVSKSRKLGLPPNTTSEK